MDAVKLIKQDHRNVKALFRKFERESGKEKQATAQQIIAELTVHATVEEMLLYPALRQADPRMDDEVLEALEEHHVAKATLAELDKMKVDDERFDAKMTVLREAIEHHIEEEEDELLPRVERLFDGELLEAMGQEMLAMKESVPDHPHPMAPDTPPGNVVAGVLAKVLDAGKNLVRKVTRPARARGQARAKAAVKAAVKAQAKAHQRPRSRKRRAA